MGSYPITTAALNQPKYGARSLRFLKAVEDIEQATAAGTIANVVFVDAKSTINSAIEAPIETLRATFFHSGKWESLPKAVIEFDRKVEMICLYVNLVPGKLTKATKLRIEHPYCDGLIALLTELLPLSNMISNLKDKVVKRQIKPVEERKEGYYPPPVSTQAQQRVVTLLEDVTAAAYETMQERLRQKFTADLEAFLKAAAETDKKGFSTYTFFVKDRRYHPDFTAEEVVGNSIERDIYNRYHRKVSAAEVIAKKAKKIADEYRFFFVHKNYKKIASVIEAKGNLKDAKELGHSVSLTGLTGTFYFSFRDNSSFRVVNQVVGVVNKFGTSFVRFPLTFHDPVMPNGKLMNRPSEKRMNDVFVKGDCS